MVYSSTWERVRNKPSTFPTTWNQVSGKPAQATRWPSWNEVTGKPAYANRWPSWGKVTGKPSNFPTTWNQVSGKPTTFPPASHHHDDRYIRSGSSGNISGNLSVSGTVTGNRLVTGDVGGDRWCRANSAGRIQCTHDTPGGSGQGAAGWPIALRCGNSDYSDYSGIFYWLVNYNQLYAGKNYMRYSGGVTISFLSDGTYQGHTNSTGYVFSGCKTDIDKIPASRKIF